MNKFGIGIMALPTLGPFLSTFLTQISTTATEINSKCILFTSRAILL